MKYKGERRKYCEKIKLFLDWKGFYDGFSATCKTRTDILLRTGEATFFFLIFVLLFFKMSKYLCLFRSSQFQSDCEEKGKYKLKNSIFAVKTIQYQIKKKAWITTSSLVTFRKETKTL